MNDVMTAATSPAGRAPVDDFLAEALRGLARPQKTLPCKFLYDETHRRPLVLPVAVEV